jgi:tetratricopeptide (TPR) repeat protein
MNENTSFQRKIVYVLLLALLLFPISQLGSPATLEDRGGKLAQLRDEYELGQSDLGDIDPASETIRMATLGLRGIAVSMLWSKANEFKKKEDWTNFRATLEQLSKLQPYFISFWKYQAWNLTYNVSVELDAVRDRFGYVKRGIEFLKEGTKFNRDNPHLLSELGWFVGNKIGRADEHVEYRRMFKADDDFQNIFHDGNPPPLEQRDNWLVSRKQYEESISVVDDKKKSIGQKNPTTFFAAPAMSQINYSEAIEEEGTFGEKARSAWRTAANLWQTYGNREMRSSRGTMIRLADLTRWQLERNKLQAEFDSISTGVHAELVAERRAKLPQATLAAMAVPAALRSEQQNNLVAVGEAALAIGIDEIADRVAKNDPSKAGQASRLANRIKEIDDRIFLINNNRQVANYDYWKVRVEFEQTADALRARELAYEANRKFKEDADLLQARELFEESFDLWAKVFKAFPSLPLDSTTGSDIMDYVEEYSAVLEQLDLSLASEEVDKRFALWDILIANDNERKYAEATAEHNRRLGLDPDGRPVQQAAPSDNPPAETPPAEAPPVEAPAEEQADNEESPT